MFLQVKSQIDSVTNASETDDVEDVEIMASMEHGFFHHAVILQFLLCAGVSLALALLGVWHALLISQGQTSIEQHINKKEKARLKKNKMVNCKCFILTCSFAVAVGILLYEFAYSNTLN